MAEESAVIQAVCKKSETVNSHHNATKDEIALAVLVLVAGDVR